MDNLSVSIIFQVLEILKFEPGLVSGFRDWKYGLTKPKRRDKKLVDLIEFEPGAAGWLSG